MIRYIMPVSASAVAVLSVLLIVVSLLAVLLLLFVIYREGKIVLPPVFSRLFNFFFQSDRLGLVGNERNWGRDILLLRQKKEDQDLSAPEPKLSNQAQTWGDPSFQRFNTEAVPAGEILSSLNLGIVTYALDGHLSFANEPAAKLLGEDGLPRELNAFMGAYCDSNGIMARLLLGKNEASGLIHVGSNVINLTARVIATGKHYRKTTIFILQDITRQELQEQKRKEFVANVSHELKTPLTTIITYSESLLDWGLEEKKKEALRNDLTRIHDDANRMQNLVTDLLLLSSIDSDALHMRMESLDLGAVVKKAVEHLATAAADKKIDLSCTVLSILPPVFGDRTSLDRIVSNLVSNAVKYTDVHGTVKVYVGMVHDEAYVKVTDNGYGIDEKHLSKIFDRFYRVDMTGSRMYGGTGLGLSIVRELVDMHAGQISVKSAVGSGTSFTVLLPLAKTVHNKTLSVLETGGELRNNLQQASLMEILSQGREAGLQLSGATELNAGDLTLEDIKLLRNFLNEEEPTEEEIMIEAEPIEKRDASAEEK